MEASTNILTTTINDLPENALVHILSFSPTLNAISTSVLARSWRNLWHQVPGLHFDIIPFYKKSLQPFSLARALFADCISRAFFLLPPHRPLQNFQLAFHYADFGSREIEVRSWIRSAVERGILKLDIHFYDDPWMEGAARIRRGFDGWAWKPPENMHITFEFWFSDIIRSSVREVHLHNCGICFPSDVNVGFESLKTLVLRNVLLTHTHQIERMVLAFANLESLNLEQIENSGVNEFRIHLKRLKKLTLRNHYSINFDGAVGMDIDTPELLSLKVINFGVGFSSLRLNVPSLVEADFDFTSRYSRNCELWHSMIISFQNVRRLRIQNMNRFLWEMLPTFNYLKHLELVTGFAEDDLLGIFGFLEASPVLESVVVDYHYYKSGLFDIDDFYYDELKLSQEFKNNLVDLKMPSLREITMKNYRNTRNEMYLVELFKTSNMVLEKIVAVPPEGVGKTLSSPIVLWEA